MYPSGAGEDAQSIEPESTVAPAPFPESSVTVVPDPLFIGQYASVAMSPAGRAASIAKYLGLGSGLRIPDRLTASTYRSSSLVPIGVIVTVAGLPGSRPARSCPGPS